MLLVCVKSQIAFSQEKADSSVIPLKDIEVSFLSSYYQQDGDHSAVTGGKGTEKLSNVAPSFTIVIPAMKKRTYSFTGGVDYYTSASSDNINNPFTDSILLLSQIRDDSLPAIRHLSGASSADTRGHIVLGYKKKKDNELAEKGVWAGLSLEYDVVSTSFGGSYNRTSKDKNKGISVKAGYFFDNWKLIYPVEHRIGSQQYLPSNKRHTISSSISANIFVNKRMAVSVSVDLVVQKGLLSTPFHRVYFPNEDWARVEQLPSSRMKYPASVRFNYHITNFMILRSFYRYYQDSWSASGHTVSLELPIKLSPFIRVYPSYRFHQQSAIEYFDDYRQHVNTAEFFTSDFDLSNFSSNQYSFGVSYSPLFGVLRFKNILAKNTTAMLKSIELKYNHYERSNDLQASFWTFELLFTHSRKNNRKP